MPAASPGYAGNPGPSAAAVRQGAGIVPVGATDVAPAGRDVVPAIGMGPAPGWPAGPAPVASAPPGVAGQPAPLEPAAPPDDKKIAGLTFATASDENKSETRASWGAGEVAASVFVLVCIMGAYLYFTG